jgi:hypothetical protein
MTRDLLAGIARRFQGVTPDKERFERYAPSLEKRTIRQTRTGLHNWHCQTKILAIFMIV